MCPFTAKLLFDIALLSLFVLFIVLTILLCFKLFLRKFLVFGEITKEKLFFGYLLMVTAGTLAVFLFPDRPAFGTFLGSSLGALATLSVALMSREIQKQQLKTGEEQREIAHQKLQLDIFNKRYEAYAQWQKLNISLYEEARSADRQKTAEWETKFKELNPDFPSSDFPETPQKEQNDKVRFHPYLESSVTLMHACFNDEVGKLCNEVVAIWKKILSSDEIQFPFISPETTELEDKSKQIDIKVASIMKIRNQ